MRRGTVVGSSGGKISVELKGLGTVRIECDAIKGVSPKSGDEVAVGLLPGGTSGIVVGVM